MFQATPGVNSRLSLLQPSTVESSEIGRIGILKLCRTIRANQSGQDDSGCQEGWFCPVGRVDMKFTVGDTPGDYVTTITLYNGNSISMIVTAE